MKTITIEGKEYGMKKFIAAVAMLVLAGCSNSNDAMRALTNAGYTDISTHGWAPLQCGRDDTFSTKFTATNPAGNRVSGVVCSGLLFKNATIRF